MSIVAKNYDADAAQADVPHCSEDDLALVKVGPGVGGAEAPIPRERNGGNNEFSIYTKSLRKSMKEACKKGIYLAWFWEPGIESG